MNISKAGCFDRFRPGVCSAHESDGFPTFEESLDIGLYSLAYVFFCKDKSKI